MSHLWSHIHNLSKFILIISSIFLAYCHLAASIDIFVCKPRFVSCLTHTALELRGQNQTSLLHNDIYLLVANIKKLPYTPIKKYLEVND